MNDGPQRKITEESGSLKRAHGIVRWLVLTDIRSRLDVGNAEMIGTKVGRIAGGISGLFRDHAARMEIFCKCGERNRSM